MQSFLVRLDHEARGLLAIGAYLAGERLEPRGDYQVLEACLVLLDLDNLVYCFPHIEYLHLLFEPAAILVQDGEVENVMGEIVDEFDGLLDLADALLERCVDSLDAWQDLSDVENLGRALLQQGDEGMQRVENELDVHHLAK